MGVDVSAATRQEQPGGPAPQSSRRTRRGAGWEQTEVGSWTSLLPGLPEPLDDDPPAARPAARVPPRLSWFTPRVLWTSRNDFVARISDPVPALRQRWVGGRSDEQLRVDLSDRTDFSFLLMGDTGEGDCSQYALVPPLTRVADECDAAFVFICGDVLYPVGNVNEYGGKFFFPYRTLQRPIYSLPGNHDWYDGLAAYMYHFCSPKALPPRVRQAAPRPVSRRTTLARMGAGARLLVRLGLWRSPDRPVDLAGIELVTQARSSAAQRPPRPQPGPYYVIDTAHLRIVCLDTGILGNLDQQQGEWLLRVSEDPRPKILLTGKPLLVNGGVEECEILGAPRGFASVLQVVHDARFRYVAAIGGDIHNYQHYPVRLPDPSGAGRERVVDHVVSGGGGAFMHATHTIPPLDPEKVLGVTEAEYRAYPLRRDSLAAYSKVLQGMLDKLRLPVRVQLDDRQAAEFLHETIDAETCRPQAVDGVEPAGRPLTRFDRLVARLLLLVGGRRFHQFFSPFYDWDQPPFFKHFLRIDVTEQGATVRCYAVTGRQEDEEDPAVEDQFTLTFPAPVPGEDVVGRPSG